jgi:glyoxylase-like metal-dependent hydrolase (beta-lactamase superfamily II)
VSARLWRVSERIVCIRRASYLTCSYAIRAAHGGIVLVEAGMDSDGRDVERALGDAFGARVADVRAILITHWHNDHAAGAAALKSRSGARVYYHRGDEPQLTRRTIHPGLRDRVALALPEHGPLVLLKGLLGEAIPRAVTADVLVEDEQLVEDDFVVLATPGHTPGHVAYFYRPERVLFAGDALAVKHGRVALMSRPVTPDLAEARRSAVRVIDRALALGVTTVCPGHQYPLAHDVAASAARLRAHLARGGRWPLFG